jgi:ferredoxin
MKQYKIIQQRDKCVGCGHCQSICKENWEMDNEDFLAKPKKTIIDEAEYPKNQEAAEGCPVQCIQIEEIKENI